MSLRNGNFCTIWKAEDKGKYSVAQVSTSGKNREGQWEVDFQDGFVRLVGQAHEFVKKHGTGEKGLFCKIMDFEVTRTNGKDDPKKVYTNYVIFKLEEYGNNSSNGSTASSGAKKAPVKSKFAMEEDDTPQLPF